MFVYPFKGGQVAFCSPSYKHLPPRLDAATVYKTVFDRLTVLCRIDEFYKKYTRQTQKGAVLDPWVLQGGNAHQEPQLAVIVHRMSQEVFQDFIPDDWPIVHKTAVQTRVAVEIAPTGTAVVEAKDDAADDGVKIEKRKRRHSFFKAGAGVDDGVRTTVATSAPGVVSITTAPLVTASASAAESSSALEIEALGSALLIFGFSTQQHKLDWLAIQETRLFSLKLGMWWINSTNKMSLITDLELPYEVEDAGHIKVPMCSEIAEYLASRSYPVWKGYITLPQWALYHVLVSRYLLKEEQGHRDLLCDELQSLVMAENLDPHLRDIGKKLGSFEPSLVTSSSAKPSDTATFEPLTIQSLNSGLARAMPPCMIYPLSFLKRTNHLRHAGRMQLWPFLRDCGMSMEDQMALHKSLWDDKSRFDKEHTYTLRHIYGLEGKKQAKTGYGCDYIVNQARASSGEAHGCPFRWFDRATLQDMIRSYGVHDQHDIEDVAATVGLEGPQLACRRLFELAFPNAPSDDVGINPKNFFVHAQRSTKVVIVPPATSVRADAAT